MSFDMVICYDKCVGYHTQIVAAALHVKKGTSDTALCLGQLCHPYRSIALRSLLFHWQIDVVDKCLWSRLAATATCNAASLYV